MPCAVMDVEEINYVTQLYAVREITQRPANDQGQRQTGQPFNPILTPAASAVNSQRCQPPAWLRKLNAAP